MRFELGHLKMSRSLSNGRQERESGEKETACAKAGGVQVLDLLGKTLLWLRHGREGWERGSTEVT